MTMQTLNIDGTTYRVKFDRDPIDLAKQARKPYKPKKPKDLRRFPTRSDLSTADYIRAFDQLNNLTSVQYTGASKHGRAVYDPSIPLMEDLSDAND